MTKKIWMTACAAMTFALVTAQNQYDAERIISHELSGTARYVGMGGAMSALGGDLSVMGTNPAGIGIYRSSDASVSFGFHNRNASSQFNGTTMKEGQTKASFDQAGFVYAMKYGNNTSLRYVNFGFNYKKSKDFSQLFSMGGALDGFSQSFQLAGDLEGTGINSGDKFDNLLNAKNPYRDNFGTHGLLSMLAARTGVTDFVDNGVVGWDGKQSNFRSEESGGIHQYDFNVAFNIEDRFYFGATMGLYDVNYKLYSSYSESLLDDAGGNNGQYTLSNYYRQSGGGVDLKLGFILRPFENDPFRIGFSVHTPTWYELRESYDATLSSDISYYGEGYKETLSDYLGSDYLTYDYNLMTPWKFNVSMGTTLGGLVALGAEWEYQDYSTAKLRDLDDYSLDGEYDVKESLQGVHTFKVGMESRLGTGLSLRAGYNYTTAAYKSESYNYLALYSTRTDFMNTKEKQAVTFGLGYKGSVIYADIAYKYDMYKADFYAFDDIDMAATKVDFNRHQMVFTLGARF
ncbi:MAG: OmpP1/FadL family transporter [Phocaeicola sp.]